jgi:hypothetical protein
MGACHISGPGEDVSVAHLPRRLFVPGEAVGDTSFEDWLAGIQKAHEKLGFKGPAILIALDEDGDIAISSTTGDLAKIAFHLDLAKAGVLGMATGEFDGD